MVMKTKNPDKYRIILAIIISVFLVLGFVVSVSPKDTSLFGEIRNQIVPFIALILSIFLTVAIVSESIFNKLDIATDMHEKTGTGGTDGFSAKKWVITSMIILLCWMPYLIICYPTITRGYDYFWQLLQGIGVFPLSEHHPELGSYVYGGLFSLGYNIGGASFALFFSSVVQMMCLALSIGFSISVVRTISIIKDGIIKVAVVFFCICPIFPGHAVWLIKDSLFTAVAVFMFSQFLFFISYSDESGFIPKIATLPAIAVSAVLFTLLRNGVTLIAVLILVISLVVYYRNCRDEKRKCLMNIAVPIVVFIVFSTGINMVFSYQDPYPTNAREALSMPVRQIARTVQLHPADLSTKEREVLKSVYHDQVAGGTTIEEILGRYDDTSADYIKVDYIDNKDVLALAKVWVDIGLRHPGAYFDAAVRGTDGYWYPFKKPRLEIKGAVVHTVCTTSPEEDFANNDMMNTKLKDLFTPTVKSLECAGVDTEQTFKDLWDDYPQLCELMSVRSAFPNARVKLENSIAKIEDIPVLSLFLAPGTYLWLMLFSFAYLFSRNHRGKNLWPILIIELIAWLSPVNGYTRYVLPIEVMSIIVLLLCFSRNQNEVIENDDR